MASEMYTVETISITGFWNAMPCSYVDKQSLSRDTEAATFNAKG